MLGASPGARQTWRVVLSVGRYLLRMGRPTPFGLIAGVAPVTIDAKAHVRWGSEHQVLAQAGGLWLRAVVTTLEGCAELRDQLPVVVNSTLVVRGDRVIVPHQPHARHGQELGAVDVSLAHTTPVCTALAAAATPIRVEDLVARLRSAFPAATPASVTGLLTQLMAQGALISSLHAPATEPDALAHLLRQVRTVDTAGLEPVSSLITELEGIHADLQHQDHLPELVHGTVAARMHGVASSHRHPMDLDLRLDVDCVLPAIVPRRWNGLR